VTYRRAQRTAGIVVVALGTLVAAFVLGMRSGSPVVVDAVRKVNRAVFNPHQMRSAGTPGAYASVIRHRGRRTGRDYETPVVAVATPDGFVIVLVYGSRTDWLRNVLATRSATVVHEGRTYDVTDPEIVPIDSVADLFAAGDRLGARLVGVTSCLRVRTVR
jgi:deazaflavin-dependent oxidoreductase (nitroreductase family)